MKIDRKNYELYFIDYLEGNLSPLQERELMVFLEGNPDLKEELQIVKQTRINPPSEISFPGAECLKKDYIPVDNISPVNIDEKLIDLLEGNASKEETAAILEFLELNPAFGKEREMLSLTKLIPDKSVTYPVKNKLKRRAPIIPLSLKRTVIVAASVAALLLIALVVVRFTVNTPEDIKFTQSERVDPVKLDPVKVEFISSLATIYSIKNNRENSGPGVAHAREQTALQPLSPIKPDQVSLPAFHAVTGLIAPFPYNPDELYAFVPDPEREVESRTSVIGKVFRNLFTKAADQLGVPEEKDDRANNRFDFWTLADYSLKGYNALTDKDVSLVTERNERGRVTDYSLVEEDITILDRRRNLDE